MCAHTILVWRIHIYIRVLWRRRHRILNYKLFWCVDDDDDGCRWIDNCVYFLSRLFVVAYVYVTYRKIISTIHMRIKIICGSFRACVSLRILITFSGNWRNLYSKLTKLEIFCVCVCKDNLCIYLKIECGCVCAGSNKCSHCVCDEKSSRA